MRNAATLLLFCLTLTSCKYLDPARRNAEAVMEAIHEGRFYTHIPGAVPGLLVAPALTTSVVAESTLMAQSKVADDRQRYLINIESFGEIRGLDSWKLIDESEAEVDRWQHRTFTEADFNQYYRRFAKNYRAYVDSSLAELKQRKNFAFDEKTTTAFYIDPNPIPTKSFTYRCKTDLGTQFWIVSVYKGTGYGENEWHTGMIFKK